MVQGKAGQGKRKRQMKGVPGISVKGKAGTGKKKTQMKGGNQQKVPSLSEATRIKVAQILEQFQISNDEVYQFEANLTNDERQAVHLLCRKMGMKSKSSGKGLQRRVSVYKSKKGVDTGKGKENLVSFRFSEESKAVLQDLFSRYPPNDVEMTENKVGESTGNIDKLAAKGDDMFCKPSISQPEIAKKVESLASAMEKTPKLREMAEQRSKLPIASFRDTITSLIDSHQVVLVCGETGCGKTTQVPQFLLDHAWSKGESCKIICTQPRRISATSVAERVASERGEKVGDSVGYKIRLESKGGSHSSLVFCTNGVLLRVLVSKGGGRKKKKSSKKKAKGVFGITHIIVDEIHERDRFSDFMLPIIRDMLSSYPSLRLVLMSATIDAERFSDYFGGCPVIRVPGFTYPVNSFYLEDVLSMVKLTAKKEPTCIKQDETIKDSSSLTEEHRVALDEAIDSALSNDEFDPLLELISFGGDPEAFNYRHSRTGVTPLMVFAGKGRVGDICMLLSIGVDCHLRCNAGKTAFDYAEQVNQGEAAAIIKKHMDKASNEEEQILLDKYLSKVDPEHIDYMLIEQLLRRICSDSKDGAILVFLPGWDDINRTRERLVANPFFKDTSKFVILSLHSMVPLSEQKKVFQRPPSGCRKIVLSTNIAETSLTIDDVVYVIDSGRMKEKNYDPYNNVSTLHSSWVSKASARQREGRAGRCQPGICYHLYSKLRADSLPDFQVPEIKRMPIEELCLQVKLIDPDCKIEDFLNKTLDPPVYETIHNAIVVLQDIGALSSDEKLTELGAKLGSLPVHPQTSKMLFLSILLNCLDPALTLACASDYRDPFVLPMLPDGRKRADAAKSELASLYGGKGDQLAVVAAFECWKMAKSKGQEAQFCSQYFLNAGSMKMLSLMRNKLKDELARIGFIPKDASHCSLNAQDPGILHAVIVGNLYPMVGRFITQGNRSLIETADGNKVRLHPQSTNAKLSFKNPSSQALVVFDEVTRGDGGLIIRNCSLVGCLPLLLLANEIAVAPNDDDEEDNDADEGQDSSNSQHGDKIMSSPENIVKAVIDRWLPFNCTALEVAQIYCLRERLSAAILYKVKNPDKVLPEHLGASLYAIAGILSCDGMSGVSLLSDSVDSLATMVSAADINRPPPNFLRSLMHNAPYHHNRPPISRVGVNQLESVSVHRPATSGTSFARGKVSKRQRGSGFR